MAGGWRERHLLPTRLPPHSLSTEKTAIHMTRLELYNLVWSTPTSQLSRTLGYSDVGIAKICRKHKIPRPPRGYWAKKQAGQTPRQIPLPDPSNNSVIELRVPNMNQLETPERTKVDRPQIKVAESLRGCH